MCLPPIPHLKVEVPTEHSLLIARLRSKPLRHAQDTNEGRQRVHQRQQSHRLKLLHEGCKNGVLDPRSDAFYGFRSEWKITALNAGGNRADGRDGDAGYTSYLLDLLWYCVICCSLSSVCIFNWSIDRLIGCCTSSDARETQSWSFSTA